ncbi:MAG TPA: DinB family protein [Acidimicrobiales bacterium]
MANMDVKGDLHTYLRDARETLVWKMDGLGEYDIRRPLTPTGTNLLGLVKHSGSSHVRYLGGVFGRADDASLSWLSGGAEPNAEMWAAPDEGREEIVDACRRAWDLADATITELPLDAMGRVPWWGSDPVTLHRVLVHLTAETQRHAGHADIVRELIDGSAGLLEDLDNLQMADPAGWSDHHDRVESAARLAEEI